MKRLFILSNVEGILRKGLALGLAWLIGNACFGVTLLQATHQKTTLASKPPLTPLLTLYQAHQLAYAHNPNLEAERANQTVVEQNKRIAWSRLLPQLNVQASYGRQHNFANATSPDDTYNSLSTTTTATQTLLDLPSMQGISVAETQRQAQSARLDSREQSLVVEVADQYFQVIESKANLKLKRQEAQESARQLEEAEARFKVGLGIKTDVEEARATFDTNQANIILAEEDLNNQLKKMALLLNLPHLKSEQFPDLKTTRVPIPESQRSLEDWLKITEEHNPDWRSIQQEVQAASQQIRQKQAGHLPTLQVQGMDSRTRAESTDTDGSPFIYTSHQQNATLNANWVLFQGGSVLAQTDVARAQKKQKQEQAESLHRSLEERLENAFAGFISTQSEMKALQQSIFSGQSALEATEAGLAAGTRTRLNVLEQVSKLYGQKRKLVGSTLTFFRHVINLKLVSGTLTPQDLLAFDNEFQTKE